MLHFSKTFNFNQKKGFHYQTFHFRKAKRIWKITKVHSAIQLLKKEGLKYENILDTSSLFKLYHKESDTAELELIFSTERITHIFLSEISKIEFTSTIWKKVRTNEITALKAPTTLDLFELDFKKFSFIATDSIIIEQARILMSKYATKD